MTKKCPKCNEEKLKSEFYTNRASYDGLGSYCKKCQNEAFKQRYRKNPKKYIEAQKLRMEDSTRAKAYKQWKDSYNKVYNKEWKAANRGKIREYERLQRTNNLNYKLAQNLRTRLRSALKGNYKKGSAIANLGCSVDELKQKLELKFQPGMTWKNYGEWHIDHIKPLASFDLTDEEQFKQACHYSNLQPLWGIDNLSKSDKLC